MYIFLSSGVPRTALRIARDVGNERSTLPGTSTSQLERCWAPEIPNLPSCFKVDLLVLGSKFHITLSSISLKDHEIKVKDLIFPYINM